MVRAVGLEAGLVDVKVCAIDETWSGLKFVVRLKDRPMLLPTRSSSGGEARWIGTRSSSSAHERIDGSGRCTPASGR